MLHVASVLLYVLLPVDSPFRSPYGLAAYALRSGAFLTLLLVYLRLPAQSSRIVGFYLLLSSLFDAVRIHTLWVLTRHVSAGFSERRLAIVQSVIVAVGLLFLIIETAISRPLAIKENLVEVNEQDSSTLGKLFFGWVWPLLALGRTTSLVEADIKHVDYHPYAVHWEERAVAPRHDARRFYSRALTQYLAALVLSILSTIATLIQPSIIGAIVRFMELRGSLAVGTWLVVAMFVK